MNDVYYPPPGFHFRVTVLGVGALAAEATGVDASFQEVSGIESRFDVEEVAEGGENRFVHRLPRPARYTDLVLKRGIVTRDSFFAEWVGGTIGSTLALPIVPQTLLVTLLDADAFPVVAWAFVNAWPLRWVTAPMDSMSNEVLTETMEFTYEYFERLTLGGGLSASMKLAQAAARLA
ncbi:MAG TPA: phage tail protein [Longimicrobium sp.]|nr:phage tail protein [Longimicrobium sp.]